MSNKKQTKAMRERERERERESLWWRTQNTHYQIVFPKHLTNFSLMPTQFRFSSFSSSWPYFGDVVWRSSRAQTSSKLVSLERYWCLVSIGFDLIWFEATVIEISCLKLRWHNVGNLVALFLKISFLPIQGK